MSHISSYKELRVYQAAMKAAMRIFELANTSQSKNGTRLPTKYDEPLGQFVPTSAKPGESADTQLTSSVS